MCVLVYYIYTKICIYSCTSYLRFMYGTGGGGDVDAAAGASEVTPACTVCRSPGRTLAKEVCYKNLHIFIYIYPAGVSNSTTIPPHTTGIG